MEIVGLVALVGVVAAGALVVGLRVGMLIAPRIDRLAERAAAGSTSAEDGAGEPDSPPDDVAATTHHEGEA